jgi:hypothetical protein
MEPIQDDRPLIYQDNDAFYENEMKRAGQMLLAMKRERDDTRRMLARIVEAAGGEVRVTQRAMMLDPSLEMLTEPSTHDRIFRVVS